MIRYLINRPIAVTMILFVFVVIWLFSMSGMPVSLMPDIEIPQITVLSEMSGMSAQEMETKVVAPLRGQLSQVSGVKDIYSDSRMDMGSISIKFEPGANMNLKFIEVNEKIDLAMESVPKNVNRPKVIKTSATDIPAFYIDVCYKGNCGGNSAERIALLGELVSNVVCRRIEQLPSVAMVDVSGLVQSEILCEPNESRLTSLGMTIEDLQQSLADNDIKLSALTVADGIYRYKVNFDSHIFDADDVSNIYIRHGGRIFQMKDVCSIGKETAIQRNILRHDGKRCITLAVIKRNSASMNDMKEDVKNVVNDLQRDNPNVEFDITRDQTELLSYSIDNLEWNILAATIFTVAVLFFFIHRWRLALLVSLSIPVSLIVTILCFRVFHITLNIISLSGLVLGVGMIVDNSIIVVDNILQKLMAGMKLSDAVVRGTGEVFTPMLSSVLTTCSVLLPLVFLGGKAGALFYDQGMAMSIALLASLVVSLTVLPVYFNKIYRYVHSKASSDTDDTILETTDSIRENKIKRLIFEWYECTQFWMFKHRGLCMILFFMCMPGLVFLYIVSEKRQLPELNYTDGIMCVDWNSGISVENNDSRINSLLRNSKAVVETSTSLCGTQDFLLFHTPAISSSEALVYFKCASVDDFKVSQKRMLEYVRNNYPEATVEFHSSGNLFDLIFSTGEPDLRLMLQDRDSGRPKLWLAKQTVDSLRINFPWIVIPQVMTEKSLLLKANVEQMAMYGVSFSQLCNRLRQLAGTNEVIRISNGNHDVPILIGNRIAESGQILSSTIKNTEGVEIPLSLVLSESVKNEYKHLYGSESGCFYPIDIKASGGQVRDILKYVNGYKQRHHDVQIITSGDYFTSKNITFKLVWVFATALFLLFFILAAQFESVVQPVIILSEIVIDVFFVLMILWLTGVPIDIMSMNGLIVMSGIVINDSILKIDTINHYIHHGAHLLAAIENAGRERLMPIIMTSLTTILSLLPFMSKGSIGAELQYPLSFTIFIGMIVGTLVSIFFVPIVYYSIYNRSEK